MAWARSDGKDASWVWRWQLGSSKKKYQTIDRPIKWRGPVALELSPVSQSSLSVNFFLSRSYPAVVEVVHRHRNRRPAGSMIGGLEP